MHEIIFLYFFREPMATLGYKLLEGEKGLRPGDSLLEPWKVSWS
jgi:hypothetical protein